MFKSNVNHFYKKTEFDNFESDFLTKLDRIKNKREILKTSPNYRCDTGGIERLNNCKVNPTIDSFNDDKLYTHFNSDSSNFNLSKKNFSKRYSSILNEFSPYFENNINLDFNQRLNLRRIQSKMENKQTITSPKISNKIQDLKYNYLTQKNPEFHKSRSPSKSLSDLYTGYNELRFHKTNLITDKIKNKMINFMQSTNNLTNKEQFDSPIQTRCFTPGSFNLKRKAENFKSFSNNRVNEDHSYFLGMSQTDNLYKNLEREMTSPNKKKESQKSEIASLLNSDFNKKSYKRNEKCLEDVCEKEKISKFHFFSKNISNEEQKFRSNNRTKIFLNSDKYSSDIVSKMQKKFPDFVRQEKITNPGKNLTIERSKLAGIKSQIDKLFN